MNPFTTQDALRRVVAGATLTEAEMAAAIGCLMDGQAHDAQIGGLLSALALRGETDDEVSGAVQAMRSRVSGIRPKAGRLLDTCGTGGDGAGTFNISTAVAFVAAAAGVAVAKHGNRAVSSSVGSADVLEALGVALDLSADAVCECVDEVGIGFLFAPAHHAALRHAGPSRRALGFRTMLNLLGPMTNPAGATHQLVGVFARDRLTTVATVLGRLGSARALVVHGADGLDELTLGDVTHAAYWDGESVRELELAPEDAGLDRAPVSALAGGTAADNAALVRRALAGEDGPVGDVVRLNAGAALWVAGEAEDLSGGVARASEVMASGAALAKLDALAEATQRLRAAGAGS